LYKGGSLLSEPLKILAINGSPRKKSNSSILLEQGIEGAKEFADIELYQFEFHNKKIGGCRGSCISYCQREGKCVINDDLNELLDFWIQADGIIFAAPVYHMGPPGQVKCAVDRLGNIQFAYLKGNYPRYYKACGAIVQGSSRWGGQEITIQFFIEHFLTLNCIPITGDMPASYLGVAGYAPSWENDSILQDQKSLENAKIIGRRVAETAAIIKAGRKLLADRLPDIYFYDRVFAQRTKPV
jgi:multimeric flavodoxin WrbA